MQSPGTAAGLLVAPPTGFALLRAMRVEFRPLFRLSLPVVLAQLGLNGLSIVDTAIVGNDSTLDFEAATLGRSVMFMVVSLGLGVALSLEPMASQALAAGEKDRAWGTFRRTVYACIMQWPFACGLAYALTYVLPMLRVGSAEVAGARLFVLGNAPGILFFVLFMASKTFLQAHGRTLPLVVGAVVANVVNYFACSVLVRGDAALVGWGLAPLGLPHLGPLGAGLANSVASAVLFFWTLAAARSFRAVGPTPVPSIRRIVSLGLPMGLQLFAEIGAFTLAALLAAWFGPSEIAAYQIAVMLASQTFMAALGVSGATAVRVGRAIGEGRNARPAGMAGIGLGVSAMFAGVVLFTAMPVTLVQCFTKDPAVIALGVPLVRLAAVFQLFDGVQVVSAGALRGAGDARYPFVANVVAHWAMGFPVAMIFAFGMGMGAMGLWFGLTVGLIAVSVGLSRRFWRLSRTTIDRV
jgi:multidrug resistance protein, MATE family